MKRRQTMPEQSLIIDQPPDAELWSALRRLPFGSGVLLLCELRPSDRRRLRHLATLRRLSIIKEQRRAAVRVHNIRELRGALAARTPLILLSPLFPTRSHPEWVPIPRMRAAAFARLGGCRLHALGGMDARCYAKIARLGFIGWAGISAFRT